MLPRELDNETYVPKNCNMPTKVMASELPRLSTYLRTFGNLSPPQSYTDDHQELVKKRKELKEKNTRIYNLNSIKEFLTHNSSCSSSEIDDLIKELLILAKEIVGSESSSQVIEGSVVFLLELFRNCSIIGQKQKLQLRRMFGLYSTSAASKAFEITQSLINYLNLDIQEEILNNGFPKHNDCLQNEEFGCKIKFVDFSPLDKSFFRVPFMEVDDEDEKESAFKNLSFKFEVQPLGTNQQVITEQVPPPRIKYNQKWLHGMIQESFSSNEDPSSISADITSSVIQLLKSSKSSEELQDELFQLLGFDRLEIIQDILQHRDEIIHSKILSQTEANSKDRGLAEKRPTCMSQVTIQSETEKLLSKQIRKDERRIQREQDRNAEENGFQSDPQSLDPRFLKEMREAQLHSAKNTPLFSHPVAPMTEKNIYPNVYDIYTETRMSASFISGRKMVLPENSTRTNNSVFEEITIPPSTPANPDIGKNLVSIKTLDEIGQIAFKGTEKLNRIQSMVFDTAYHTNENMLVCAPTGAGKTNVAMLTIIHELKNNIEHGVLQKNKFKIVYVAPMKALAAEMVRNFGSRLSPLGVQVKELTGDMQLTKTEIVQTQMLVTTPEKWDVVTRKATGDIALSQLVKLLILDEVHLLDGDRGPVLEALVARTLRQVETSQSMIRIIGLSATLPNYIDVASFLRVNPMIGLFFFDDRFRPVPLSPTFIGVKSNNPLQQMKDMDDICFRKILGFVEKKHQVMVFVHARNATVRTATVLKDMAITQDHIHKFTGDQGSDYGAAQKNVLKSRNKQLKELFEYGFAIHHAGMLRSDRNLVEKYFRDGHIKVLVCTSTLAWGVNLPARAVVIKGTEIYDSQHGTFIDLSVLDVMQIFGRAGRPQFDTKGEGTIITTHDKLSHYLSLLTRQHQIESKFDNRLEDNLNAEIALGTVTNVYEAVEWLSYTYLHIRMLRNPHHYGLKPQKIKDDYLLIEHRKSMVHMAAKKLHKAHMIRYDPANGFLNVTDMGRTASHFYISTETIIRFNEIFERQQMMNDCEIFKLISHAQEFDQLKVRDDEMVELDHFLHECQLAVTEGVENTEGKVNVLLQMYLCRMQIESFSLISDQAYVVQNATRIVRSLFEMALRKNWAMRTASLLRVCKMFEKQIWSTQTPLRQFPELGPEALAKLDKMNFDLDFLREMDVEEIGLRTRCHREKRNIKMCVERVPNLHVESFVQPITDCILRINLSITPDFKWSDKHHGCGSETFWIWIEDPDSDYIYHFEYFILPKKQVIQKEAQSLIFTIPLARDVKPNQYLVRVVSDRWLGSDSTFPISFKDMILPHHRQPHTDLLSLQPLPVKALKNLGFESLYKFEYFNPIQSQVFHTLYHTDHNVLLGAPTGSGKTIAAEIAMFRVFNEYPGTKVVYIAPLKALVRERMQDWKSRFNRILGKRVVELTGDVTPDASAIANSDIIVTTPEKWDGISRSWQTRNYVKAVSLIVIDEIHLLGEERGPVLEVIVSRTNFISSHTARKLRVVGLSTALANATDIANWLGIKETGLYNFRSSVRPVQLEVHVSGYHGKHYCPRMALMNKPTFQAIRTHSPDKPALVFVSSRRQTRLTALDLIAYLAAEENPRQWVHMCDQEMHSLIGMIKDQNLKLTLAFGIGLHHAGLHERDRKIVEELFLNQKIQVLIATATLAWGINLPAHLVVIKGTEYFDGKVHRYVDFPITDVMQMAGRAGRPQFDTTGVAVVLVHDIKKNFYKKFLHEPFPVESSLIGVLPEHLNAEVVAGTISSKQQCLDYLTWTYFFRRLLQNPTFYGLEAVESTDVNAFLSGLVDSCLQLLSAAGCLIVEEDERTVLPTVLGKIASYYYLNHKTILVFTEKLHREVDMEAVLKILCDTHEYEELPVRHNEDSMNSDLAKTCPLPVEPFTFDSPHTKANLLLQAHFSHLQLPCTDYYTDLKSVLDQAIRIIQAMIDVSADKGWLSATLQCMTLLQMILQARWHDENTLLTLPHIEPCHLSYFRFSADSKTETLQRPVECLPKLIDIVSGSYELLATALRVELDEAQIDEIFKTLRSLPIMNVSLSIKGWWDESKTEQKRPLKITQYKGARPPSHYLKVHADQEYVLTVDIQRLSKRRSDTKAIAPKFPKQKEEGWFLVLGSIETKELVAMKRLPYIAHKGTYQLVFYTPEKTGPVIYTLYLISDCYLGLDQQYDVSLNVIESSIKSQINSEVISDIDDSSSDSEDD